MDSSIQIAEVVVFSLVGGAGVERVYLRVLVSYSEFVVDQIERVREIDVMTLLAEAYCKIVSQARLTAAVQDTLAIVQGALQSTHLSFLNNGAMLGVACKFEICTRC